MILTDNNLLDALRALDPRERKAVEEHINGKKSYEAMAVIRRIRASLKRKARSKLPKFKWLV